MNPSVLPFFSFLFAMSVFPMAQAQTAAQSDVMLQTMLRQTAPKTQDKVSACSIFSATAALESKLIQMGVAGPDVNLSEQWMVYITAGQKGKYGIFSKDNIRALSKYGFVTEKLWPFNPTPWSSTKDLPLFDFKNSFIQKERCGHLKNSDIYEHCLVGQRDPRLLLASNEELLNSEGELTDKSFYELRNYAEESKSEFKIGGLIHKSKKDVLNLLNKGETVLLDVTFYYEAWNHRKAPEQGLERDMSMWSKGIVSYPHPKSKDYVSKKSGHSVLLVGYDNNVVIERTVKDADGNPMVVRTVGVYYFKNSWGQNDFGRNFTFNGHKFPGYGMISMDYAHEKGLFVQLTINGK